MPLFIDFLSAFHYADAATPRRHFRRCRIRRHCLRRHAAADIFAFALSLPLPDARRHFSLVFDMRQMIAAFRHAAILLSVFALFHFADYCFIFFDDAFR